MRDRSASWSDSESDTVTYNKSDKMPESETEHVDREMNASENSR
jgi:hypothetical protein